jgi:anhydro-N-acetylmuramic acid kinase
MRVAGIMSGTSLDGVDVRIVDIEGKRIRTVAFRSTPYTAATRQAILDASTPASISRLNFRLGEIYCESRARYLPPQANPARQHPSDWLSRTDHLSREWTKHASNRRSRRDRRENGIPVVSDFRPRDIAAGGKGAPLVPFVDHLLFSHRRGIASLSI